MQPLKILEEDVVKVTMGESVLVDQAPKKLEFTSPYAITEDAKKWGGYRMPKVYRFPNGTIALTYSMSIDHYYDQGRISPLFISKDDGQTWEKSDWPHSGLGGMHPVISPVFNGEYYTIPARDGICLEGKIPSEPRTPHGYVFCRLADCRQEIIDWYNSVKAVRWSPESGWTEESLGWDNNGRCIWAYEDKYQNIPDKWGQALYLEHPVIRLEGELFVAEYWTQYEFPDGGLPKNFSCYLMVSNDNGHSWKKRSTIALLDIDAAEPHLEVSQSGELVCAIRTDAQNLTGDPAAASENATMYITHSKDKGYTWDKPKPVIGYGVFPQLLQLDNGVMVLSYGRAPDGTCVSFSLDGGYSWSKPRIIIAGKSSSCGYTSLLPLDRDTFLLAYGDIHCKNSDGEECKSILVRKITVKPN